MIFEAQFDAELDVLLEGIFGDTSDKIKVAVKAKIADIKKSIKQQMATIKDMVSVEINDTIHMSAVFVQKIKAFFGKNPHPTNEEMMHALSQMGDIIKVLGITAIIISPIDDICLPVILAAKYLDNRFNGGRANIDGVLTKYLVPKKHYDDEGEEIFANELATAFG